jgi:hypothetical protein
MRSPTTRTDTTAGRCLACAAIAIAGLVATPAAAQGVNDKYWIELSGHYASPDTKVTFSRPGLPGTKFDMESDLGLNSHEFLPDIYGGVRLGEHWLLTGEYYGLDRNGSKTVTRDITFDGVTYPANIEVDSKFRSNIYRFSVGYSFFKDDKGEFGADVGLHTTNFKIDLNGQARAGGPGLTAQNRDQSFTAPLPTLGLYGVYEVAPKVSLNGRFDWLNLKVGDYDGEIFNVQASVAYNFTDLIAVGGGWRYVDYNLNVDRKGYTAKFDYKFNGPSIFLRLDFH